MAELEGEEEEEEEDEEMVVGLRREEEGFEWGREEEQFE